ncbi:MAG TPA: DUF1353 domain-containing protein [Flavitalea sp.]|nr:DUF1353 domain-containing protein [Flavitalea sp.]
MKRIIPWFFMAFLALVLTGFAILPNHAHKISFFEETCIKPHDGYSYLTCYPIKILIDKNQRIIPANFDTDLASIPRWYWSIASPSYAAFIAPAILHDYLYQCPNRFTRKTIDEIFYYALIENGVGGITAYEMYVAVRLFGSSHYHGLSFCIYKDAYDEPQSDEYNIEGSECDSSHIKLVIHHQQLQDVVNG